ncbi:hypothetical protein Q3V23_35610 [Streptomyces sp. VNUA116]|uniref:hypothetical protein n=1 Tax=Streptomyces sp. VNUA116 TaxID=3062449 RepID=UPI00267728B8|nr:hypothetical protein [Streptomyces sp. VNUA116]WKU48970.1 hypothetical protein Q3V23_35610 [Streptomyces sp. VNUA116]
MLPFRTRRLIATAAALAGAFSLATAGTAPAAAAAGGVMAQTLNCSGSIRVNITNTGSVDGKGTLRCATPTTLYDGQLTLSGSATVSGLVYQTRTADQLSIFAGSSGEIIDLSVNRTLKKLADAPTGNATESGSGLVVGGGPFGGSTETESGTGTFGTTTATGTTTFLITDNYVLDLHA